MNTLRRIIEMAKANPRWARVAIALDATIGLIVGLVAYLLMNLTGVPASAVFVLLFGATLAVVGIIVFAYSIFITNGFSIGFGDGVEEGEDCPNCGQEWTGTL
jgi:hypothetical protein